MKNTILKNMSLALTALTILAGFTTATNARACTADGIYLGLDDADNLHYAIRTGYSSTLHNFKNEALWYHNSVSFKGLDEGLNQVDFKIQTDPVTQTATLIAMSKSRNVIDNPRHIKGLVFKAVGIPLRLNLAQAIQLVVIKQGCTWNSAHK